MAEQRFTTDLACATGLDESDPLRAVRSEFHIPKAPDGGDAVYLVGNSLGATPKTTVGYVQAEIDRWAQLGVHGHHTGELAWEGYHELLTAQMAEIVGGRESEVVVMNALTVNLHLLMISFYRPTPERHKIIIEEHAFPSDHFAVESQIRQRGFDPAESMVVVRPREGEDTLRHSDIIDTIRANSEDLALVMLPGVHYYTGQVFDMRAITDAAHSAGALAGFDLAHAVGNIELELHDWDVDFAAWCTYKYLNGGPGSVGGSFVNERHVDDQSVPKFLGWWGTAKDTRFEMDTVYKPIPTAESWQLSNAPILSMAALRASLDLISRAGGVSAMRRKSVIQIAYMDHLLAALLDGKVVSLTPTQIHQRGCQFALQVVAPGVDGRLVFERLEAAGIACDWRYPDVIRAAPVPLYNSFADIHRFVTTLAEVVR